MDVSHDLRFTDRADDALGAIRRLVVPTDLPGVDCLDVARAVTKQVASERGFSVVLYDRSAETWMDHPHPSGPHRADELSDEFDVLAGQLRELDAAGIDASGWISTVPSLTEIAAAIDATEADAVLLPEPACDRTLVDRLTSTGDQNEDVVRSIETNAARPVIVFSIDDGCVDLVATTD